MLAQRRRLIRMPSPDLGACVPRDLNPHVSEDRHDPLLHIAQLTKALKSAYRNTAFLSIYTTTELPKLLFPGGRE
jgi:hypothetical protein